MINIAVKRYACQKMKVPAGINMQSTIKIKSIENLVMTLPSTGLISCSFEMFSLFIGGFLFKIHGSFFNDPTVL
jgi:hypothetical protein